MLWLLLLLLVMLLFPPVVCILQVDAKRCYGNEPLSLPHEWYQPGSYIIGGVISQLCYVMDECSFRGQPSGVPFKLPLVLAKLFQNSFTLSFAIDEINKNPQLLPNTTLGFHIYDSYYNLRLTYRSTLDVLFKLHGFVPNYECGMQKNLLAIVGGLGSETSFCMADIINLYKIPQISYSSFATKGPKTSFYRMVPNETHLYKGIMHLLQHFGWTWVGLFVVDDDSGDDFLQALETLFTQNGICSAFTERISQKCLLGDLAAVHDTISRVSVHFTNVKARTLICHGDTITLSMLRILLSSIYYKPEQDLLFERVWITTTEIDFLSLKFDTSYAPIFPVVIFFTLHSKTVQGFKEFLQSIKPTWTQGNQFLKHFWQDVFACYVVPDPDVSIQDISMCTGEESLENLPAHVFEMDMTGHSYSIYNAIYALAHTLNAIEAIRSQQRAAVKGNGIILQRRQPWEMQKLLQDISFNNSVGEVVFFNDNKEMVGGFDIRNLIHFPNDSIQTVKVGRVGLNDNGRKKFIINENTIMWPRHFKQVPPISVCNEHCAPGHQKKGKEGAKFCCYDCAPCLEGKVSNETDADGCFKCPADQYSDKNKVGCIPKKMHFLSLEEPLGICVASTVVFFSILIISVLGIFVKHRETPIVKANNRDFTYILLVSLLFCCLSSLLFLGQPGEITCFLQTPAFSTIFSVAVSCLLAKTTIVYLAFVATKPGSQMKKWVGGKLAYVILFSCTLLQTSICMVWLAWSPPFPELYTHILDDAIIVHCNKGSATMFFCVLSYMGLLAIASFIVAFLVHKLPEGFNEAKFITFSMLVICCVWVSFVPTYLCTKGKHAVAVEVCSILFSSGGLLGFIFAPKCYILLLRPDLNCREQLIRR